MKAAQDKKVGLLNSQKPHMLGAQNEVIRKMMEKPQEPMTNFRKTQYGGTPKIERRKNGS